MVDKNYVIDKGVGLVVNVKTKDQITKVKAVAGFAPGVKTLCKIRDTDNGYIVKFTSYSSTRQDNYICLEYSEAESLYYGLKDLLEVE